MKIKWLGIFSLLILIIAGISIFLKLGEKTEQKADVKPVVNTTQEQKNKEAAMPPPAWIGEVQQIAHPSYMAVYVSKDGHEYMDNSQARQAASMIKVYILATAMEDYKDGKLDLQTKLPLRGVDKVGGAGSLSGAPTNSMWSIKTLLTKMITDSDNSATNVLISHLGMGHINEYIRNHGYKDTILQRKMMDFQALKEGRDNYTSVRDLGKIFSAIANGTCVGEKEDGFMREILLQQTDTEVLPQVLNEPFAHKTGELAGVYHDGGIVYKGNKPNYVIVLMTNNYPYRSKAIRDMQNYGKTVASILAR